MAQMVKCISHGWDPLVDTSDRHSWPPFHRNLTSATKFCGFVSDQMAKYESSLAVRPCAQPNPTSDMIVWNAMGVVIRSSDLDRARVATGIRVTDQASLDAANSQLLILDVLLQQLSARRVRPPQLRCILIDHVPLLGDLLRVRACTILLFYVDRGNVALGPCRRHPSGSLHGRLGHAAPDSHGRPRADRRPGDDYRPPWFSVQCRQETVQPARRTSRAPRRYSGYVFGFRPLQLCSHQKHPHRLLADADRGPEHLARLSTSHGRQARLARTSSPGRSHSHPRVVALRLLRAQPLAPGPHHPHQ